MSIILITGIPGTGKTLFAVDMLKKDVEQSMSLPADEQFKVYADITNLQFHDVPEPPLNWQDTPPKSVLYYDEPQLKEPFKASRGLSKYDYIQNLTIHRKTGHKIVFITQDVKRLHSNIIDMVEEHYHLHRPYGAKLASIYKFRGAERNPRSRSARERAESQKVFNYDKSLYKLYQSSQVEDGIKFKVPKQIVFWLAILLIFVYFMVTTFLGDSTQKYLKQFKGQSEDTEEIDSQQPTSLLKASSLSQLPDPVQPVQPLQPADPVQPMQPIEPSIDYQKLERLRPASVIVMNGKCTVMNSYGHYLDKSLDECKQIMSRPLEATYLEVD